MSEVLHEIKLCGGICAASTVEVDNMLHLNMDLDASQASLGLPMGATFFPVDVVVNIKVCIPRYLYIYIYICPIYNDLASLGLPLGATFFPVDVIVNIKVCSPRLLFLHIHIYALFIMIWHHSVCP